VASTYPEAVAKIIETRCAVSGCHNQASYENAGGLRLDSWEHMFQGGNNGSVMIPYSPAYSSLLYFINTHADLGPVATPTMPLNSTALTRDEYLVIHNWLQSGAPDVNGKVPFADNPQTRQKIYVTMQSCDLVAVIDAETRIVMRYIPVGVTPQIEGPHCVRVSKDGRFAYVSFLAGTHVQKIDAVADTVMPKAAEVGIGKWNVLHLSEDGLQLIVSDWQDNGQMVFVHTAEMEPEPLGGGVFLKPHGITSNAAFNTFYVTSEAENFIYKFNTSSGLFKKVPIDKGFSTRRVVHEIKMTPDYSRYFITCQDSNEVRVLDANWDTLIAVIPVGKHPQELAISTTRPYIFVTCMEDNSSFPGYKGSVYAINYNTYEATRIEGPFYQPHAITVDDQKGVFYVVSRNSNPAGPAPHHSSSCGDRNGYYHVYDLATFKRLPKRYEVGAEPYSADTRFK
jgi:YVTN family beta-propeller protein